LRKTRLTQRFGTSSTTSYSGYSCDLPVPPVIGVVPAGAPVAARCRARLSARRVLLKARAESLGRHCHGWPDVATRLLEAGGRTCAAPIAGTSSAIAIADVRRCCERVRMLDSSKMERRRFRHASRQTSRHSAARTSRNAKSSPFT